MQGSSQLDQRQRDILGIVVRQHIQTGVPVGSKAVASQVSDPLSSATIRHVMGELEEGGFLSQPHTSAGRVPSEKAYRYYVDCLLETSRLGSETQRFIDESLQEGAGRPDQLMAATSRVLAEVSSNVGLVLGPRLEEKLLEHIKFVKLPDHRVLAVVVSRPDLIENKVIRLEEECSQEELDEAANFLNAEFRGWSLRTIRVEIFKRLEEMKTLYDRLLTSVGMLFVTGALGAEEPGPLFVEGTRSILDRPEFENLQKIKDILATFEQKAKLVRVLSACLDTRGPSVRILIGQENPESDMQDCAFIVAPFHYRQRVVGALGILGPMRMEYDRTIPTVDYVARLCSRLLSTG